MMASTTKLVGLLGGRARSADRDGVTRGRLEGSAIRAGVTKQRQECKGCFQETQAAARVTLKVEIEPNGSVGEVTVVKQQTASAETVECVKIGVRKVRFPRATLATYYTATFPKP